MLELKYRLNDNRKYYEWIVHGETLYATPDYTKPIGAHNRLPKQLAENIEILYENSIKSDFSINNHEVRIGNIESALNIDSNEDIVKTVYSNKNRLDAVDREITDINILSTNNYNNIKLVNIKVGSRSLNDKTKLDVMEDLFYIKRELGSYRDYDINGNYIEGAKATGLKYKVSLALNSIETNSNRIENLESKIKDTDVSKIDERVVKLEATIGNDTLKQTVTKSINGLIETNSINSGRLDAIETNIGSIDIYNTLSTINYNQQLYNTRLNKAEDRLDKFDGIIEDGLIERIEDLETIIGDNQQDALQGVVNNLNNIIGDSETEHSLLYRTKKLEENDRIVSEELETIVNVVGDEDGGLVKIAFDNDRALNGDVNGNTEVDQIGLSAAVKNLWHDNENVVEEAPDDGYSYIRKHKEWVRARYTIGMFRLTDFKEKDFNFNNFRSADYNSGVMVLGDGSIQIEEDGVYDIDIKLNIEDYKDQKVVISINDENKGVTTYPLTMTNGVLVISDFISHFPLKSKLNIGVSEEVTIKEAVIKIKPSF